MFVFAVDQRRAAGGLGECMSLRVWVAKRQLLRQPPCAGATDRLEPALDPTPNPLLLEGAEGKLQRIVEFWVQLQLQRMQPSVATNTLRWTKVQLQEL